MRLPLDSFLFRSVVLLALIVAGAAFTLNYDDHGPNQQENGQAEQQSKDINPPKTFVARTFDDPTAFFTATLAILTAVLAGVGVAQVFYLNRSDQTARISADAAKRSADIARDALIASQRAWIKARIEIGDQPLILLEDNISFSVRVIAENIGNAPALNVTNSAWLLIWRSDPGKSPLEEHERRCITARTLPPSTAFQLFPNEKFPDIYGQRSWQESISLGPEDIAAGLAAGGKDGEGNPLIALCVGGCITYSIPADPNKRHMTKFFYNLDGVVFTPPMPSVITFKPGMGLVPTYMLRLSQHIFSGGNSAD